MTPENKKITLIAFLLLALAYISIKISVPALPLLQYKFQVPAAYLKTAASLFLIFFSLSSLWWGAIAKYLFRRKVIFIALAITSIGTLCAMLATNIWFYIIGRSIEGVGMGVASPLCRVLLADRLNKTEIASVAIFIGLIFNLSPFVSPTLGQYLIILLDWRSIFAFFLLLIIAYWFFCYFYLFETKATPESSYSLKQISQDYWTVLKSGLFWSYMISFILFVSTMLGYYMTMPYWFLIHFHVSEKYYTFLALFSTLPNLLTYYLARFVIARYGNQRCIIFSHCISVLALILLLYFAIFYSPSVTTLIIPLIIMALCNGLIQPALNVGLISSFKENVGVAVALIPVFPFLATPIMFAILSSISLNTLWPFTWVIGSVIVFGLLNIAFLRRYADT
jgi:MFS family permease